MVESIALALAMPLLVVWTTAIALVGGMFAAKLQLDISFGFFFHALPKAVPLARPRQSRLASACRSRVMSGRPGRPWVCKG